MKTSGRRFPFRRSRPITEKAGIWLFVKTHQSSHRASRSRSRLSRPGGLSDGRPSRVALGLLFIILFGAGGLLHSQTNSIDEARGRLREAIQLHRHGELDKARALYLELIPEFRKLGVKDGLGDALNAMSLIGSAMGDYSSALEMAEEAARIRQGLGDGVGEAHSLNNVGLAYLYLGEYRSALEKYGAALRLDRKNGDFEGQVIRLNNLANVSFFQGDYFNALGRYQAALRVVEEHRGEAWSPEERRLTLANLATVYQKLGQYQKALGVYSRLRGQEGRLSSSEEAQILSNLGALYRHLGDPVKAIDYYRQALQSYRRERRLDGEISALKNLGIALALDMKDFEGALQTFRSVVKTSRETSNRRQEIQGHLYAAETLRRLERYPQAAHEFRLALAGSRELGISEEEWKALFGLGRIAQQRRDLEAARSRLREAIDVIESERSQLRLTSLKAGFLADKRDVYDALLEVLVQELKTRNGAASTGAGAVALKATPREFQRLVVLLEKARSRTFQDRYAGALEGRERQTNPLLVRQLRELRSKVSRLWTRLLKADDKSRVRLRAQLARLENEFIEKEREYSLLQPAVVNTGLSIDSIQRQVPAKSLLLDAWIGPSQIAFFWLSTSSYGLISRDLPSDFQRNLDSCVDHLARPSAKESAACRATRQLLAPVLSELVAPEVENLAIIPDKGLNRYPLEAQPLGDGSLLLERCGVFYLPSLSLLGKHSGDEDRGPSLWPWSTTLVAFGNPDLSGGDAVAEITSEERAALPFAGEEAKRIAAELTGRSRIYLGREATKERLIGEFSRRPPVLHLAAHAAVDAEDPHRSRILLRKAGPGGAEFLYLGEVLSQDLEGTQLVTLSACETGAGSEGSEGRDGVQDLGRAFLIAGARSTLATLWRVPDRATAQFMTLFYQGLSKGLEESEALRRAKLRFIHSGTSLAQPRYWAGFVLYGQGDRRLSLPLSGRTILFPLLGGLLVAAGLLLWWRQRHPGAIDRT